jgi:thiosulfate reductase cytochrome b subunit
MLSSRPAPIAELPMTYDRLIYRHRLWVRVTHWINVICMTILLMSGLQIFDAHPALYWGNASRFDDPLLAIGAERTGQGAVRGVTEIGGFKFDTTGVLGVSGDTRDDNGIRGFPAWATLPGSQWLAMGRRWHFFFAWLFVANGVVFTLLAIFRGHLRRDLVPSLTDLRQIGHSIRQHLRLRFPKGEDARHYNVLQKLTYFGVICVLCPLIVFAGLAMSPQLDAAYPWLLWVFDGRQSARTIHFVCAFSLLAFVIVHLLMVLVSGVWNNLRSIITGWYDIGERHG